MYDVVTPTNHKAQNQLRMIDVHSQPNRVLDSVTVALANVVVWQKIVPCRWGKCNLHTSAVELYLKPMQLQNVWSTRYACCSAPRILLSLSMVYANCKRVLNLCHWFMATNCQILKVGGRDWRMLQVYFWLLVFESYVELVDSSILVSIDLI